MFGPVVLTYLGFCGYAVKMLHNLAKTLKVIHSLCNLAKKRLSVSKIYSFSAAIYKFLLENPYATSHCDIWSIWEDKNRNRKVLKLEQIFNIC